MSSPGGLTWEGDDGSSYSLGIQNGTLSAMPSVQDPSVPTVPYMTAQFFETQYTYSFPVTPGRKFVRLHFYPTDYTSSTDHNINFTIPISFFTVSVGSYIFLDNFSALLNAQAMNKNYFIKEFSVNISSNTLNLTFTPSSAKKNAFAFVNGIEIVSTSQIFIRRDSFSQPIMVGMTSTLTIDEHTAFETVKRLNVGGQTVSATDDSGLYREWEDDSVYIYEAAVGVTYPKDPDVTIMYPVTIPEYIAPSVVYGTARSMGPHPLVNLNYNLTWIVTVDTGFHYLVRLHFCEIAYPVTQSNMRVFDIFINNMTAQEGFDVIAYANGTGIGVPVYLDFIVYLPSTNWSQDIWVALHPNISRKPVYNDAELNGLEIFKLNDSSGKLARPIFLSKQQQPRQANIPITKIKNKHVQHFLAIKIGLPCVVLLFLLLAFIALKRWRQEKVILQSYDSSVPLPSNRGHLFSFSEIKTATRDFSESLVIGVGGFGKVYRGEIDGGLTCVAVKRGNRLSNQGVHEFRTEIDMLSKLRHRHLVSLVGYCDEKDEMILVYDFMANGTLRDHLYKTQNPPLTWKQRLEICIGAARGFHYLHTGAKPGIIHRDVKTTNILLDDKWVAKVSDFGLSKVAPELDCTHVSTAVKGSFGYLDPEYFWKQKLTEKSDVYSFGVVLFEVLCGRPALDRSLPEEQVSLANWALHCKQNGMIDQIIDPNLKDDITRYEGMAMSSIVVNGDSVFSDLRNPKGR
ncbi:Receptor-like protein kinase FERONIA [Acorus calamus]|uniref:Receptor-like protein kinase FERONIA n=1 Tax=Acorus calamus TaxID=4465 RepID=A0AAV9C534_ACOCL|nr:Receptor-like protein kinase FERONIA [Acorus calamus]